MNMKYHLYINRLRRVVSLGLLLAVCCASFVACSDEENKTLENQQTKLLSFVTSTLGLRSYEEANDPSSEVSNANFYTVTGNTAYRWITNYYDADREQRKLVERGSVVELTLSMYEFNFKKITNKTLPFFTNDVEMKSMLEDSGLNTEFWSFEPYRITVGETDTIKGLAQSLEGCREGDIVELYMTYTMGYGGDWVYVVTPDSPLAILFTVDKVE